MDLRGGGGSGNKSSFNFSSCFSSGFSALLALTSNEGSADFQWLRDENNIPLYEQVMRKAMEWGGVDQLMFVVGATRTDYLKHVRQIAPDHNIEGSVHGNLSGEVRGDVKGDIKGDLTGTVYGKIFGKVFGKDNRKKN